MQFICDSPVDFVITAQIKQSDPCGVNETHFGTFLSREDQSTPYDEGWSGLGLGLIELINLWLIISCLHRHSECFETWLLDGEWAFNTSLLTKFLRQTEGFECLIRNAATHDSSSPQWWSLDSVCGRRVLPLNPSTLFFFPSLSFLHFVLKSLSLPSPLFPPPPLFPHLTQSQLPLPAFSTTFTGDFYLYSAWGASFLFRINYRSLLHIFVSRRDCTIGSAR